MRTLLWCFTNSRISMNASVVRVSFVDSKVVCASIRLDWRHVPLGIMLCGKKEGRRMELKVFRAHTKDYPPGIVKDERWGQRAEGRCSLGVDGVHGRQSREGEGD